MATQSNREKRFSVNLGAQKKLITFLSTIHQIILFTIQHFMQNVPIRDGKIIIELNKIREFYYCIGLEAVIDDVYSFKNELYRCSGRHSDQSTFRVVFHLFCIFLEKIIQRTVILTLKRRWKAL